MQVKYINYYLKKDPVIHVRCLNWDPANLGISLYVMKLNTQKRLKKINAKL